MIPHKLHFTWKSHRLPEEYEKTISSWSKYHPDWEIKVWDDNDNRTLIESHYPWFLSTYDAYPKNIMRADAARYFILHHEGGVYSDLDVECYSAIDELIFNSKFFLSVEPEVHSKVKIATSRGFPFMLCNAFMGSEPGHKFWSHLHEILQRQKDCPYVLDATGPFMLTGAGLSAPADIKPDIVLSDLWSPGNSFGLPRSDTDEFKSKVRSHFRSLSNPTKPAIAHLWHSTWFRHKRSHIGKLLSDAKWSWRKKWHPNLAFKHTYEDEIIGRQILNPWNEKHRILIATPMKNAGKQIDQYRALIEALDYPKELIDIAILFSDSTDDTEEKLQVLEDAWTGVFHSVVVERLDFDFHLESDRWESSIQLQRRGILAKCRNRLADKLAEAHEYCFFVDVDLSEIPSSILQEMMATREDVVMANCLDEKGKPFDLNAFFYEQYPTFSYLYRYARKDGLLQPPIGYPRIYLTDLEYLNIVPLDSVGGTALLIKSQVLREGVHFPETPYKYHIETEGFGLMAREKGFSVVGMPNLKVIHPRR